MKKIFYLFVVLSTLIGFASCGSDDEDLEPGAAPEFVAEGIPSDIKTADFMAKTKDGKTLYFKVSSPTSCKVTWKYHGDGLSNANKDYVIGSLSIPSHVTFQGEKLIVEGIGSYAFISCLNLGQVEIPATVKVIEWNAFVNCDGLSSVVIPNNVATISHHAFSGCEKLKTVTLPSNLKEMGVSVFDECPKLTTIIYRNTTYTSKKEIIDALNKSGVKFEYDDYINPIGNYDIGLSD